LFVLLLRSCCTTVIRCLYGWYQFCSFIFIFIFYKNKRVVRGKQHGFLPEIYIILNVFTGADFMKKKLLILPGYLVGMGGVFLITYRTLHAFFSESKSITVQVNRYGEQYGDLAVLVFIWIVCVVGLLSLVALLKEQKDETVSTGNIPGRNEVEEGLFLGVVRNDGADEKTGTVFGALAEPFKGTDQGFAPLDGKETRFASSVSYTELHEKKK